MLRLENDILNRRPVWDALSELWLDNQLDSSDIDYIARRLAESPYSKSDLEIILSDEVAPVAYTNLFSVAGEWAGFDIDWLQEEILKNRKSQPSSFWGRVRFWLDNPFYGRRCSMVRDEWEKVLERLRFHRQQSNTG